MRRAAAVLSVVLLLVAAACSDDATAPSTSFDLTVRVVDQGGDPVPGLDLMLLMDSIFYQDGRSAQKARVGIEFLVPIRSHTTLTIEDVAGSRVHTLIDDVLPAGAHQVIWNGHDSDDVHCYSGLYYARMIGRDQGGAVAYDQRHPMYMGIMDFDQATIATTDAAGEIVLRDKRLFPALFGDVAMQALDENGDAVGDFPLTTTMRFYLRDPVHGGAARYDRDVTGSRETIELVWPGPGAEAAGAAPAALPGPAGKGVPPEGGYDLRPPFPNPFN